VESKKQFVVITMVASMISAAVVARDLLSELSTEEWVSGRLSRTPGLFSEFAFGGLYGLSDGGSLPEAVRRVASVVLATTVIPFFVMLDGILPQFLRASDFRELPRVEFSGALIVIAVALGMRQIRVSPIRNLLSRLMIWQSLVWLTVVVSVLDRLPTVLASSGAWMTLAVVLIINLFITFVLLDALPHGRWLTRSISLTNLVLIGYWCLIQFGFATFDSPLRVPAQFSSRFAAADVLSVSDWYRASSLELDRVVISSTPSFYDFMGFVTDGFPVVAPADPKMRASDQLQSNFAFNFSINAPRFETLSSGEIDRILDFLQVRYVLVGEPTRSDAPQAATLSEGLQSVLGELGRPESLALPQATYDVYSRSGFSAFVLPSTVATSTSVCPVLFEVCPVVVDTTRLDSSPIARLQKCQRDCLWTFRTPAVGGANRLVIPVTYDDVLNVHDASGTRLDTSNMGGFLAVAGPNGIGEGELTVTLEPDIRMLSRVFVSYLNLGVFLVLLGAVMQPWVQSRRRRLRIE